MYAQHYCTFTQDSEMCLGSYHDPAVYMWQASSRCGSHSFQAEERGGQLSVCQSLCLALYQTLYGAVNGGEWLRLGEQNEHHFTNTPVNIPQGSFPRILKIGIPFSRATQWWWQLEKRWLPGSVGAKLQMKGTSLQGMAELGTETWGFHVNGPTTGSTWLDPQDGSKLCSLLQ